jgi:hypothetical protein
MGFVHDGLVQDKMVHLTMSYALRVQGNSRIVVLSAPKDTMLKTHRSRSYDEYVPTDFFFPPKGTDVVDGDFSGYVTTGGSRKLSQPIEHSENSIPVGKLQSSVMRGWHNIRRILP